MVIGWGEKMIDKCVFCGKEGFVLWNARIKATIIETGGKLLSLVFDGKEILDQGKNSNEIIETKLGGSYLDMALRGMDDMIPNINEGFISNGEWAGTPLYDHGEVWPLHWSIKETTQDSIEASVTGIHMPFKVKKTFRLEDDRLHIDYALSNPTQFEMPCVWAAHTLLIADEKTRIHVPEGYDKIRTTLDLNSKLAGYGALHTWPETTDRQGNEYFLDRLDPFDKSCEKYYFLSKSRDTCVEITNPNLKINFRSENDMYLGIWLNSFGLSDVQHIGIEPATAPMDTPVSAREWGSNPFIKPYNTLTWEMEFVI